MVRWKNMHVRWIHPRPELYMEKPTWGDRPRCHFCLMRFVRQWQLFQVERV